MTMKIGQTAAQISHLTFFKMAAVRHIGFCKQLASSGGLICIMMQNFIKIGQMVFEIPRFLFSRWPPSAILDFEIFKFLVDHQIGRPNMHRHTKFYQNRSNGC